MKALRRFWAKAMCGVMLIVLSVGAEIEVKAHSSGFEGPVYSFIGEFGWGWSPRWSLEELGAREITSKYFDKAMQYSGTRFTSLPFEKLFEEYPPGSADAVLLDCFDDYQGLISIEDIKRYRLELATQIHLPHGIRPPSWLKPLMILVPDGGDAPFQERFMTANIKGLTFVTLADYYAPIDRIAVVHPEVVSGLKHFKDNCVYCHSIGWVGGNKGGSLLKKFDFSKEAERDKFKKRFLGFHHKDNADKQNVEQFVNEKGLSEIAGFLQKIGP